MLNASPYIFHPGVSKDLAWTFLSQLFQNVVRIDMQVVEKTAYL